MSEVETIARGDDSRLVEPRRFLIRDRQAFAAVWAAHAGPHAPVPAVDFESRMAVAVFLGDRPSAGYSVEVTGTRRDAAELVIVVDERHPDPDGVAAQIIVSPYHIATLPRDDGPVRFNTPDPGGQQTIVFKPHGRAILPQAVPVTADAASAASPAARAGAAGDAGAVSTFTGLRPHVAASLAYLAGPLSGALLLATERSNAFVRFHARQSLVALGVLGIAAATFLVLAFILLVLSPTAFWVMLWLAAASAAAWVVVWAVGLVTAFRGRKIRLTPHF